jgi:hypothetical protein
MLAATIRFGESTSAVARELIDPYCCGSRNLRGEWRLIIFRDSDKSLESLKTMLARKVSDSFDYFRVPRWVPS